MDQDNKIVCERDDREPVFEPDQRIHPLELVGNASLALHHHMAPAEGAFDLGADDDLGA